MCFKGIAIPILGRSIGYKVMRRTEDDYLITPIIPNSIKYKTGDTIKASTRRGNRNAGVHYFKSLAEATEFKEELEFRDSDWGFKLDYIIVSGKPLSLVWIDWRGLNYRKTNKFKIIKIIEN